MKAANIPLVFLHYFGGSARSWRLVIDELEDEFDCIAVTLPGFGNVDSLDEPSIENFANYVRIELAIRGVSRYILVAHSMGAKIALQLAIDDSSGNVDQLILIAPSPPGIEPIEDEEKVRVMKHPDLFEAQTTLRKITKLTLTDDQLSKAVETNLMADHCTWCWWLEQGMNHSIAAGAGLLKLPITILNSDNDPVITPQLIQDNVLNILVDAKLITDKYSGHLMPIENPTWVASEIRKIVRK